MRLALYQPDIPQNVGAAIRAAVRAAAPDDVVLIAGKGHETTQQVGDAVRPFSDRETALSALGDRR